MNESSMDVKENDEEINENDVYIVIKNAGKSTIQRYKRKPINIMSIVHFVLGLVIFFLDLIKIVVAPGSEESAMAGFCSSLFIITGLIGWISTKNTNTCKISAFMVLSILSSLFGGFLFLWTLHILLGDYMEVYVIFVCFALCGLAELILGIISSSFTCYACCGCCVEASGDAEANSVVYIARPEQAEPGKPRVVHLNMKEIKRQKNKNKQILFGTTTQKDGTKQIEDDDDDTSKGYSRFQ